MKTRNQMRMYAFLPLKDLKILMSSLKDKMKLRRCTNSKWTKITRNSKVWHLNKRKKWYLRNKSKIKRKVEELHINQLTMKMIIQRKEVEQSHQSQRQRSKRRNKSLNGILTLNLKLSNLRILKRKLITKKLM